MRRTAGYTWTDYKTNSHIAKDLEITPVLDNIKLMLIIIIFIIIIITINCD